jgi:hypothetical protein
VPRTTYLVVVSADGSATLYDFSNQSVCGRWTNFADMPTSCAAFYTSIVTAEVGKGLGQGQGQNGNGKDVAAAATAAANSATVAAAAGAVAVAALTSPLKPTASNNNSSPNRTSPTTNKSSPTSNLNPNPNPRPASPTSLLAAKEAKDTADKGGNTEGGKEPQPEEEEEEEEVPNILVRFSVIGHTSYSPSLLSLIACTLSCISYSFSHYCMQLTSLSLSNHIPTPPTPITPPQCIVVGDSLGRLHILQVP